MSSAPERLAAVEVARRIEALHDSALQDWYGGAAAAPAAVEDLETIVTAQHRCNFELWDCEDQARRLDVGDAVIAATKRAIDATNQRRNDLMEKVDDAILREFAGVDVSRARLHSETAGQMIDRLSILALKIRNLGLLARQHDDAAVASECAEKVAVLVTQRSDLAGCLRELLNEFSMGRRYFKSYRQFKAYNDPRLNPALASGSGR